MKLNVKRYLCPLCLLVLMIVTGLVCRPVFYLADDVTMRSILSGAYTGMPNGHTVYMQYPLTGLLALLYRLLPVIPWFEVCMAGCIWVCMWFTAEEFPNKILGGFCAAVLFLPFFCFMHYTIVAALIAGCAIFLISRGKKKYASLALLWMAYMIRSQIGLLAMPFVVVAYLWQIVNAPADTGRQRFFQCLKQAVVLVAGVLLITGVNRLCYSGEWQEYLAYNDIRTDLYDYTDFMSKEKYAEEYEAYGMTYDEYKILSSYNLMLDNTIDTKKLREITKVITDGMPKNTIKATALMISIEWYFVEMRYNNHPYNYVWLLLFGICAVCMLWKKKWLQLVLLGLLGAGRSFIWIYLIWRGRFPERISMSLYLLELPILMAIGIYFFEAFLKNKHWRVITGSLCTMLLFVVGGNLAKTTYADVNSRLQVQKGWDNLKEYCELHSENTYLMDVYSSVSFADKLFVKDPSNLMLLGGWMTNSPLAKERIEKLGGIDAASALCQNDKVLYITNKEEGNEWLVEYLQKRFGECDISLVDEISWSGGKFMVYKMEAAR